MCDSLGYNEPSVCKLDVDVKVEEAKVLKVEDSNQIMLELDISPKTKIYDNFNLTEILHFRGGELEIT